MIYALPTLSCRRWQHAPLILFDANEPGEFARAEELGGKILELCVEVGGSISGEHGIGREKSIKCAPSSTAMKSRPSMRSRRRLTPMVCKPWEKHSHATPLC
ncbi:FAD-linked oxidase C-terminal domain-containing protein [Escherichia coli]